MKAQLVRFARNDDLPRGPNGDLYLNHEKPALIGDTPPRRADEFTHE